MLTVSRLAVAPVKGLALAHPEEVEITPTGVPQDRRFYLVEENGKLLSGTRDSPLFTVRAESDPEGRRLSLTFADGRELAGEVELGEATRTMFFGRPVDGRAVVGPWSAALSALLRREVRLVRADDSGGGFDAYPVSLLSNASLEELARQSGEKSVDGRRFRMLVHVAGTRPHEEDEWLGRRVRVGEALVEVTEQDPRCRMTTRNPDTGVRDWDSLKAIKGYRGVGADAGIHFGVYASVVAPGRVSVGDAVEPL
jgi:hypothetical protein